MITRRCCCSPPGSPSWARSAGASRQVTAGAGVTLAALTAHARAAGLDFGVDLAARDSATVGGMVATNAGGIRVLRYGSMREQVAGVEAVLIDGRIISRLDGLAKDSTGYDLGHLLAGSEGTLAVITRLRLRLVTAEPERAVALIAVRGTAAAVDLLASLRVAAARSVRRRAELRRGHPAGRRSPGRRRAAGGRRRGVRSGRGRRASPIRWTTCWPRCEASEQVLDATVASSAADRARLWQLREGHTEAISAVGVPVKLDVSVPLGRLAELVERLPGTVAAAAPGAELVVFGHLAEANLHVNVLGAADNAEAVTVAVLGLVAKLGGSISSEHGVGQAKARWLDLSRTPAEIDVMRSIKAAFDPLGLLNPHVLLPSRLPELYREVFGTQRAQELGGVGHLADRDDSGSRVRCRGGVASVSTTMGAVTA